MYVNIVDVDPNWENTRRILKNDLDFSTLRKNDFLSQKKRTEGNNLFKKGKYSMAMLKYNECLLYSTEGSTNAGLAYGNRSACFTKLKFYNEAIKDIEMAKENGFPENLMPKLVQRKSECLQSLQEGHGGTHKHEAPLSFERDENFPGMANVVKVEKHPNGSYSVVAREDIDVGKTIIVDKSIKHLMQKFETKCVECFKSYVNLVACKMCCVAMFCSTECQRVSQHEHECGVLKFHNDYDLNAELMQILRSIFKAMVLFSSADELMTFVEEKLASDELPVSLLDERSKYWALLKQRIGRHSFVGPNCFMIYKDLLTFPVVNQMFNTEKHRRFLMHLIGHHIQIYHHNLFTAKSPEPKRNVSSIVHNYFGLMSRYFNHSCHPHTLMVSDEAASVVYVTIRPIKKGAEVSTSWFPFILNSERKTRQCKLWELKGIRCKCTRCQGAVASSHQRIPLRAARDRIEELRGKEKLMGECINFLQTYGHLHWCEEIENVISMYQMLLSLQESL